MRVERYGIEIVPETPTDEAYIEEVLGLRHGGDAVALERVDAMGLSCIAYLRARAGRVRRLLPADDEADGAVGEGGDRE